MILKPKSNFEQIVELENWEATNPGIYRLYKVYYEESLETNQKVDKYAISNDFEVKE